MTAQDSVRVQSLPAYLKEQITMRIRPWLTVLGLCLLAACGGGSSAPDIEGVWSGTWTVNGPQTPEKFHAMVRNGGPGLFFDETGFLFVMAKTPADSGFTQGAETYPPYGFIFTGGQDTLPTTFTGSASNGALDGNLTVAGARVQFNLARATRLTGTPSVTAGLWSGQYIGSVNLALHVTAAGVITGSDAAGCILSGQITQIGTEDLFTVTLHDAGGGPVCGHDFTGLAYEATTDMLGIDGHATGTYYYVAAYDSTEGLTAELKVQ